MKPSILRDPQKMAEARHLQQNEGLTSYQIAERLGISPTTAWRLLTGHRDRRPTGETAIWVSDGVRTAPRYQVKFRDTSGRQIWRSFATLEAAKDFRCIVTRQVASKRRKALQETRLLFDAESLGKAKELSSAYSRLRRLEQAIDVARREVRTPRSRRHLRAALDALYIAEDELGSAIRSS